MEHWNSEQLYCWLGMPSILLFIKARCSYSVLWNLIAHVAFSFFSLQSICQLWIWYWLLQHFDIHCQSQKENIKLFLRTKCSWFLWLKRIMIFLITLHFYLDYIWTFHSTNSYKMSFNSMHLGVERDHYLLQINHLEMYK